MSTPKQEADVLFRFFSRMNAHISHDLKNALATSTETAGLMKDFIGMYQESDAVNYEKLISLCDRIIAQSKRGGELCTRFNTFSHCGDELEGDVDLDNLVDLMVSLTPSMPFPRTVNLTKPADGLGSRSTSAPAVLYFQYSIFRSVFEATNPATPIDFTVGVEDTAIRFTWKCELEKPLELFWEMPQVAERLGVTVKADDGDVEVLFPL